MSRNPAEFTLPLSISANKLNDLRLTLKMFFDSSCSKTPVNKETSGLWANFIKVARKFLPTGPGWQVTFGTDAYNTATGNTDENFNPKEYLKWFLDELHREDNANIAVTEAKKRGTKGPRTPKTLTYNEVPVTAENVMSIVSSETFAAAPDRNVIRLAISTMVKNFESVSGEAFKKARKPKGDGEAQAPELG